MLGARGRVFGRDTLAESARFTLVRRRGAPLLAVVRAGLGPGLPAGECKSKDAAVHRIPLLGKSAAVVRQLVALADVFDLRRDLGVSAARHVRIQVMLNLIAQIAADDMK